MKKRDLLKALEPYNDEQEVFVDLSSEVYPNGSQVIIQGVRTVPLWRPGVPDLIGLIADARNRQRGGTGAEEVSDGPSSV